MLLEVSHLEKHYALDGVAVPVLRDVCFAMSAGETLALEGESGSGKSTVLHLVAGLDRPTGGSILLDGIQMAGLSDAESAAVRREKVGVVFQQFNLIPSLTVRANITFHARLAGHFDPDWAGHLAQNIGLAEHLDKYPEALSGGQQQRVAIARTLAARPKLILADEPTGNLDEDTADRVLSLMLESAAEASAAILMVTHSQRLAARMARRLLLSHGVVSERGPAPPDSAAAQ
jgi:putative ABC transport system ATP-binding protein